jgi:hypothetical protein
VIGHLTSLRPAFQAQPSVELVRELCLSKGGGVPAALRGRVWQILLGVVNKKANLEVWAEGDSALSKEDLQVLRADLARTRQDLPQFCTEQVQTDMEALITVYCTRRSVKYTQVRTARPTHPHSAPSGAVAVRVPPPMLTRSVRQGLNELLAPFFELGLGSNGAIFNAFYALISKFLPNTLRGHDLKTLRRALALLRVALRYHAPRLAAFLDGAGLQPDLYATSWIVTLFAGANELPVVLAAWDALLLADDPLLVLFLALALVGARSSAPPKP